ncbi:SET domain containing protein [Venturia nashicola]|uniref:SET domain containing protein n=1 Tax=Venturia nashicola TaxID=86259 RepID=A0A4Z1P5E7_9PEZI|nr:SET domain containing protein [Venturia nashicola]TLD36717.1 SET domain containing protein [Venturia nashicola]
MATITKTFDLCPYDHRHMIDIRQTKDRGQAIFAARDIPRGTKILSEWALLVADNDSKSVEAVFKSLPLKKQKAYLELVRSNDGKSENVVYSIFVANNHNNVVLQFGSRFNHSCIPVVERLERRLGRTMVYEFVTLRHVRAGEEISTSYLPAFRTRKDRQKGLSQNWRFNCACPACGEGTKQWSNLEAIVAAINELDYGSLATKAQYYDSVKLHKQRYAKLEDLAIRLEAANCIGRDAHKWHATVSCAVLGKGDTALVWARRAADLSLHQRGFASPANVLDRHIIKELESIPRRRSDEKTKGLWSQLKLKRKRLVKQSPEAESRTLVEQITWPNVLGSRGGLDRWIDFLSTMNRERTMK